MTPFQFVLLPLKITNVFAVNIYLAILKQECQYYGSTCLSSYRVLTKPPENVEETSSQFSVFIEYVPRPLYWFSSSTGYS